MPPPEGRFARGGVVGARKPKGFGMDFRRSCATIYVPNGRARIARVAVPAWVAVGACLAVPAAAALAVMLAVGIGPSWLQSGSPLARENEELRATMVDLDVQVERLAAELDELRAARDRVAEAVALPPVTEGVERAVHPVLSPLEVRGLLQQARAQRAGYAALLDTVVARRDRRARVPSASPSATGRRSSAFGYRLDPFTGRRAFHHGLDLGLPTGTPVRATADGRVAAVERQRGLGLLVRIDHGQGLQTVYGHLERTLVKRGEPVRRGSLIALSGNSGRSTAPHLHYEVRRDGRPVDPRPFLLEFPVASR